MTSFHAPASHAKPGGGSRFRLDRSQESRGSVAKKRSTLNPPNELMPAVSSIPYIPFSKIACAFQPQAESVKRKVCPKQIEVPCPSRRLHSICGCGGCIQSRFPASAGEQRCHLAFTFVPGFLLPGVVGSFEGIVNLLSCGSTLSCTL